MNARYSDDVENTLPRSRLVENPELFEGDIVGVQSAEEIRNAIIGQNYRWPQAVIPYVISAAFCKYQFFQ